MPFFVGKADEEDGRLSLLGGFRRVARVFDDHGTIRPLGIKDRSLIRSTRVAVAVAAAARRENRRERQSGPEEAHTGCDDTTAVPGPAARTEVPVGIGGPLGGLSGGIDRAEDLISGANDGAAGIERHPELPDSSERHTGVVTLRRLCLVLVLVVSAACGSEPDPEVSAEKSDAGGAPNSSESEDSPDVERDESPVGEPLGEDTELRPGERRLIPLGLHCGIGPQLQFNERTWNLADTPLGPVPETGAGDEVPADWPRDVHGNVEGYIGLGEDDAIRLSLADGRVLALYQPSEEPFEQRICA